MPMLTRPNARRSAPHGLFIGRFAAAVLCWLAAACAATPAPLEEELPAVESFDLGPFTLHVATRPFRVSWFHAGKLLLAQRAHRAGASVEVLGEGGWSALGDVIAIRKVDGGVTLDVAGPDGAGASNDGGAGAAGGAGGAARCVEVKLVAGASKDGAGASVSLEVPGAQGVRDDWIPAAQEVFFAASGFPRLVFSSRGYVLLVHGGEKASLRVFQPDPDALRVQATGPMLQLELWPGSPKDALRRRAHRRTEAGKAAKAARAAKAVNGAQPGTVTPRPRAIGRWEDLRAAVSEALEATLMGETPVAWVPALGTTDRELLERTLAAAALLPAPVPEGTSERLRRLHAALEPFFKKHAALAVEEGIAGVRPLFVEYPRERDAWLARDEWFLGPDILAAPVVKQGAKAREVWIPPGAWIDAWKKPEEAATIRGPARIVVEAPPGEPALYLREEAVERYAEVLAAARGG